MCLLTRNIEQQSRTVAACGLARPFVISKPVRMCGALTVRQPALWCRTPIVSPVSEVGHLLSAGVHDVVTKVQLTGPLERLIQSRPGEAASWAVADGQ